MGYPGKCCNSGPLVCFPKIQPGFCSGEGAVDGAPA